MRIITGKHKGRKLYTLEGKNTRPMMDKMKESVFNVIGPYFDGGIVLDLFGGSGALSLEAISRGCSFSYIVEVNYEAIKVINKNIETLGEGSKIKVLQTDYQKALNLFVSQNQKFDYVFLDPPFKLKILDDIIKFLLDNKLLNNHAYIICQYARGNHNVFDVEELEVIKNYNSANNEVAIYMYKG